MDKDIQTSQQKGVYFVTNYRDIRAINARYIVRRLTLLALAGHSQLTKRFESAQLKHRIQFLYFHHIFKDEEKRFRALLNVLSKHYHFIGYSEAVDKLRTGQIDAPYISISFDDGLKNCLKASRIMNEFGAKSCFFVCTSMIDQRDYNAITKFCSERLYRPPFDFLSWDNVEELLDTGHEIGSHTVSHANLADISVQQAQEEIGESYEVLVRRIGQVKHFSWPYGRFVHFSPQVKRMVFDTGYQSCASAVRGCHTTKSKQELSNLCIRRDVVVAAEPISHTLYFITRNAESSSPEDGLWPKGWD